MDKKRTNDGGTLEREGAEHQSCAGCHNRPHQRNPEAEERHGERDYKGYEDVEGVAATALSGAPQEN